MIDDYINNVLDSIDPDGLSLKYMVAAIIKDRDGVETILEKDELENLAYYNDSPLYPEIRAILNLRAIRNDIMMGMDDLNQVLWAE